MSDESANPRPFWMTQQLEERYPVFYQLYFRAKSLSLEELKEQMQEMYADSRVIFYRMPDQLRDDPFNFFIENRMAWSQLCVSLEKLERYDEGVPALVFQQLLEDLQDKLQNMMTRMRIDYYSPQFANEMLARVDLDPARMLPPVTRPLTFDTLPVPTLELAS